MNLSELRALVRLRIRDGVAPYLVSDDEIDANLNEAQREACARALLIDSTLEIDLNTEDMRYALDTRVIDVIDIKTSENSPYYENWTLTETEFVLDSLPTAAETITMHCYLLPANGMVGDSDMPEIRTSYHTQMIDWAISLCYLVQDAEMFDQDASDRYAARFVQAFGERISAQTRRNHRSKTTKAVNCNGYI